MQRTVYLRTQLLGSHRVPAWLIEDQMCERTGKILRTTTTNSTGEIYGYSLVDGEQEFELPLALHNALVDLLS